MFRKVSKTIGGRELSLTTGHWAKQADGAVVVSYGDSTVLSTVCVDRKSNPERDFLPLTVEYREKSYAIGKIPGNFFRREGRPNAKEILSARQIDRPLRPLFPKGFTNEVQIIVMVLSSDQENDQDTLGLIGSSAACALSPVPLKKIVSAVRVGYIDGEYILNPTFQQIEESDINIVVAGSDTDILMVEGNCYEVAESLLVGAIEFAKGAVKDICDLQRELAEGLQSEPMEFETLLPTDEMIGDITSKFGDSIAEAYKISDKSERRTALSKTFDELLEAFAETYPDSQFQLKQAYDAVQKKIVRDWILDEKVRIDGRTPDDIRQITCEVGVLPRSHGSALFTRGQTPISRCCHSRHKA